MKKWIFRLIMGVLIAGMVACLVVLGVYFWDSYAQESRYDELAQLRPDISRDSDTDLVEIIDPVTGEAIYMLPEFKDLYELNNDIVGWLTIPGTKVDYPVMQTPEEPEYYLNRNFDKKRSQRGCLFVHAEADVFATSDNVTIFGHHMRDGSMFAQLDKYKKASFRDAHPYVYFDTLTERNTYEVVMVFRATVTGSKSFLYYENIDFADQAAFDAFMGKCRSLSLYDTDVEVAFGDKLLCLSTCEYSQKDGRLVVVAKRIEN